MFAKVEQDVRDRVADLAWCGQRARVVTVAPDLWDAHDVLDGERDADGETLNAFRQGVAAASLDDRVHVVLLHGKVEYTKLKIAGSRD